MSGSGIKQALLCLEACQQVKVLLEQVYQNQQLLDRVQEILPPVDREHAHYASLESGTLYLVTDSPAWAMRLRFMAPEVMARLAGRIGKVQALKVRVLPEGMTRKQSSSLKSRPLMTPYIAEHLVNAAQSSIDSDISRAFLRIARYGTGVQATDSTRL